MNNRACQFAEHHNSSSVPLVVELVRAIDAGTVALRTLSESASSEELAQTYEVRSSIAASKGLHELSSQMQALSLQCKGNAENPCTIWVFEGTSHSYAVFELIPSQVIAGCFKFEGPFESHGAVPAV